MCVLTIVCLLEILDEKRNVCKVDVGTMVLLKGCWMADVDVVTIIDSLVILEGK